MRNHNTILISGRHHHCARRPTVEQARFIGKYHTCHYRTRLTVNDATDGLDGSFLVIAGIVVQSQFRLRHVLQCLVHASVLAGQGEQLVLGHGKVNVHVAVVTDRCQRLRQAGADQCPCTVGQCPHHPVAGTLHFRIGEVVACAYLLGLGLRELRLGGKVAVFGSLQAEFRNHFLRIQFLVAVISQFGSSQCGTCRFHIGNDRFECSLVGNLVDDEKQLSPAHLLPLGHTKLLDGARHLRINIYVLPSAYRC